MYILFKNTLGFLLLPASFQTVQKTVLDGLGGTAPVTKSKHVLSVISKLSTPLWKFIHASNSELSKKETNLYYNF